MRNLRFIAILLGMVIGAPFALASTHAERDLVMEEFFRGRLHAEGKFTSSWTGSERGVKVVMNGAWNAKARTLTLKEDIVYSDGEKAKTVWEFTKNEDGSYSAIRDGKPAEISVEDGVVYLRYPAEIGGYNLHFVDKMELIDGKTVLNTADVHAFGFLTAGTVELTIRKASK
jgi:hypothetical protein